MVAAVRSSSTPQERAAETTTLVNYPATISANDTLVLVGSVNTGGTTNITTPSGWTKLYGTSLAAGVLTPHLSVFITTAVGTETGTLSVAHSTGNSVSWWQMIALSGIDTVTPQDVTATTVDMGSAAVSVPLPTLTPVTSGDLLFYAVAENSTANTNTAPTSPSTFTELGDRSTGTRAATTGYLVYNSTSATGTVNVTQSASTRAIGVLFAFRPSGATFTDTLTLSGSGSLAFTGTPTINGTAALSGSGSLSFTGSPATGSAVTLFGSGTLTFVRVPAMTGTVALSGVGTLTFATALASVGTLTLGGSGSLSFAAKPAVGTALALSGAGTLTFVRTPAMAGTLALSGSGQVAFTRTPALAAALTLSGSGSLAFGAIPQQASTLQLSGAGALTFTTIPGYSGSLALSGSGQLLMRVADRDVVAVAGPTITLWANSPGVTLINPGPTVSLVAAGPILEDT